MKFTHSFQSRSFCGASFDTNLHFWKMITRPFLYFLLLLVVIVCYAHSQAPTSTYVIEKDFFNVMKPGQFSIYGSSEQQLQYRIQSQFAFGHSLELFAYPSNELIAKLKSPWLHLLYKANISVFDTKLNQWIDGQIRKHFTFFDDKYTIEWNGKTIIMETKFASLTTEFRYQNQEIKLASFSKRLISFVWSNKYDLELFSNELPEAIYIMALAAKDHTDSQAAKNSGSSRSRKS